MVKKKSKEWFIKTRGSYLPNSWQGWLTYVPFTAYLIATLVYADRHYSDLLGALFFVMTQFVIAAAVMTWMAKQRS